MSTVRVEVQRARYLEEVTAWQPPSSFEYTIRETSLPLRHRGSRLALAATAGGTHVTWTSDFDVPIPIVGSLLRRGAEVFERLSRAARRRQSRARSLSAPR